MGVTRSGVPEREAVLAAPMLPRATAAASASLTAGTSASTELVSRAPLCRQLDRELGVAAPRSSASTDQLDTGDDVDSAPVVGMLEIGDFQH